MASVLKKLTHKKKSKIREAHVGESSDSEFEDRNKADEEAKDIIDKEEDKIDDEAKEEDHDSENDLRAFKDPDPASKEWKNRQRTLVVCSRGIAGRMRHLVKDLTDLVPNTKMESKLNRKDASSVIDEMCFEKSCNNFMFFEQRKQKDLFLWLSKSPAGPSVKFMVTNIHTTDELKLTGNCLKYSRPLLSFDESFDSSVHLKLLKEMMV